MSSTRCMGQLDNLALDVVEELEQDIVVLDDRDLGLVGREARFERGILLHLLVLVLIGTPLAWHKLGGGIQSEWVGYALDVGRFEIGITELRAQWAIQEGHLLGVARYMYRRGVVRGTLYCSRARSTVYLKLVGAVQHMCLPAVHGIHLPAGRNTLYRG